MEWAALYETVNSPLLPPIEGREESLVFSQIVSFKISEEFLFCPKIWAKLPQSLGYKRCGLTVSDAIPCPSLPPFLSPTGRSLRFVDATPSHTSPATPSREPWSQVSVPPHPRPQGRCAGMLHHCGHVCCHPGPPYTVSGRLASTYQPVSLGHSDSAMRFSSPGTSSLIGVLPASKTPIDALSMWKSMLPHTTMQKMVM